MYRCAHSICPLLLLSVLVEAECMTGPGLRLIMQQTPSFSTECSLKIFCHNPKLISRPFKWLVSSKHPKFGKVFEMRCALLTSRPSTSTADVRRYTTWRNHADESGNEYHWQTLYAKICCADFSVNALITDSAIWMSDSTLNTRSMRCQEEPSDKFSRCAYASAVHLAEIEFWIFHCIASDAGKTQIGIVRGRMLETLDMSNGIRCCPSCR